jgi:hypothetical protein
MKIELHCFTLAGCDTRGDQGTRRAIGQKKAARRCGVTAPANATALTFA